MTDKNRLAINGGQPVRNDPFPRRHLIGEEEKKAAIKVFDDAINSGQGIIYNGKFERQYENDFSEFMGGGFTDAVNSGTNAIYVAIGTLQIEPFSEIIVPPITDTGGVMPVALAGCIPVAADSDPATYNISAKGIQNVISKRTKAIIVAHIGGEPADMAPIIDIAQAYNLFIIEDCSQAHGARYRNQLVGTFGDISTFSTMYSKHFCTGPQGGIVFTKNEELYWRVKRFADRGKPFNMKDTIEGVHNVAAGLNCNLGDLAAAIGSVQLKKLPEIIEKRVELGEKIKSALTDCQAVSMGWQVPETKCVYWFIRFHLDLAKIKVDKNQFCQALKAEGIPVSASYRYIPCENPWFTSKMVFGKSGFPWSCSDYKGPAEPRFKLNNAINATDTHFNLHIHENFRQKEIDDIITAIRKVERAYLK